MAFSELLAVSLCAFVVFGLCIWYYIAYKRSECELERIVRRDLTYDMNSVTEEVSDYKEKKKE
ncbi:hypothetical protein [Priestia megaterium]|uniref:Uncharacterized protein n=1 Tax=Priestia megaterium TaxID=1404 RepID=A0A6M6E1A7_PRIMG|nr:hypothetical protein [Priestia megaterium]QJX80841.1 hypothetical protein FDZ14_32650 [Priestia megaterium]